MSEEKPGIGAVLRHAREAMGWSTRDVGSRLRLMSRQIDAMEAEDFSRLGPPVFARGFVRNYARLLGLNPDEMLDRMTRIKTPHAQEVESLPFSPRQGFWTSPVVLAGIAAVFLLIAVPAGLYLWLDGDDEPAAPAAEQLVPPPAPPPAPQPDAQSGMPSGVAPAGTPPQAPATPAAASQAAPVPVPATPSAMPQAAPGLRLQFDQSSWVQIRDSSGRMVHSGLNPAGSSVEINGKAPFYLVVGNAHQVRVNYKGQPVDLAPFISSNVARLTLN